MAAGEASKGERSRESQPSIRSWGRRKLLCGGKPTATASSAAVCNLRVSVRVDEGGGYQPEDAVLAAEVFGVEDVLAYSCIRDSL